MTFKDIEIVFAGPKPSSVFLVGPEVARYYYKVQAQWKLWITSKGKHGEKPPRDACAALS